MRSTRSQRRCPAYTETDAETAQALLNLDDDDANEAFAEIEATGQAIQARQALTNWKIQSAYVPDPGDPVLEAPTGFSGLFSNLTSTQAAATGAALTDTTQVVGKPPVLFGIIVLSTYDLAGLYEIGQDLHTIYTADAPNPPLDYTAPELQTSAAGNGGSNLPPTNTTTGALPFPGSTGGYRENLLRSEYGGGRQYFETSLGPRIVDDVTDDIAREAKTGYQALTSDIELQIAKDTELLQSNQVKGVEWHFYTSPVTGEVGPSGPLSTALRSAGIKVVIHP